MLSDFSLAQTHHDAGHHQQEAGNAHHQERTAGRPFIVQVAAEYAADHGAGRAEEVECVLKESLELLLPQFFQASLDLPLFPSLLAYHMKSWPEQSGQQPC